MITAQPDGTFLYFAYGSNMLTRRLTAADRAPSASPLTTGFVAGRRLAFHKVGRDGSGKCDAEETSRRSDRVFGVVFEIAEEHRKSLDSAEGLGCGYSRGDVLVVTPEGVLSAETYFAIKKAASLRPYHWYKALVVAGAMEHDLPDAYVEWLRATEAVEVSDAKRRAENEELLLDI